MLDTGKHTDSIGISSKTLQAYLTEAKTATVNTAGGIPRK
jgi:hypothetical protein